MKISVIVAAYNAEKYLEETLNSLLLQTIDDYEIIVVNDGSSDSTQDILTEYELNNDNFHVINKENGGPSSARNAGLDIAKGDYVFFFDADDILVPDALECLYEVAIENKADLVVAKYDIFNRYRTFRVDNINDLVKLEEIEKYHLKMLWTFSLCNKLFKRSLIEKYNFRLPPISYSEDGAFLMEYVYHTEKITGLNKVIFHYRRMYDGEAESITASVSPAKVKDYITAHHMILESAWKSILKDFPEYKDIDEAKQENIDIRIYLNEIIRKELQVLINQFYNKFWDMDENTIRMIVEEIEEKMQRLDMRSISVLIDSHPDLSLFKLYITQKEVLDHAYFTAVLYGEDDNKEDFLNVLKSLTLQNLIGMKILVPESMKTAIEEEELMQGNVIFMKTSSENEMFHKALEDCTTPYITFCNHKVAYSNNAFKYAFKRFIKTPADFLTELLYHKNYGKEQAVYWNELALNSLKCGMEYNPFLSMDHLLANKFFKAAYLKKLDVNKNDCFCDYIETFYKTGYYSFLNDKIVIYEDREDTFLDFVRTPETTSFIEQYINAGEVTLNSTELLNDQGSTLAKLQMLPRRKLSQKVLKRLVTKMQRLPIEDRVMFFSIRKNKELEGNAAALYPYVKGEKIICAKQLPHNRLTEIRMFKKAITSKVIVTDDYVRYLRHFPLRPEQRVIQLWHACGAFKKFGQRGTNLSLVTDLATHAQYNLVSVSGESIRPIYADAFDIDYRKVRALGTPRTDCFFDEAYIEGTRSKIFTKHPELEGKFNIIYAPTFRDVGKDRTNFNPELDFDKLSEDLLPNQQLIICPHPVMLNDIVPKEYDNIQVLRDFSTNELMLISDMLITDYSSVIFEYALLKKPIAFFCYDLPIYNRGFYLDYNEDLPGDIYETQEELTEYLQNAEKHEITDKYEKFVQKYMSACDGHSCERIADLINSYMEDGENVK